MDERIRRALSRGHRIDITTHGRRTGRPRRIEIVFHNLDGRIFISGIPVPGRTRARIRNLEADPRMTFHLKGAIAADLEATARVVTQPGERRAILPRIAANWGRRDVEAMIADSPLIEVTIPGYAPGATAIGAAAGASAPDAA